MRWANYLFNILLNFTYLRLGPLYVIVDVYFVVFPDYSNGLTDRKSSSVNSMTYFPEVLS